MATSLTDQTQAIAEAFVSARREARGLAVYPGERPTNLAEAYRIQDAAIALDGREVIGWKVGRINPPDDARLGSNRLPGPIFADSVAHATGSEAPVMPVYADGFAAAEAELLLHVAPGWDGQVPSDDAGTKALLDDVRLGIEIASSPYAGINADGPVITTSDFGNNNGLVIGASLEGWREVDLCGILVRTVIDGQTIGEKTAATMLDGPYGAVRFLLANAKARGIDLSGGTWVSTGAITGVHEVGPGAKVEAVFGPYGSVHCIIGVATPI